MRHLYFLILAVTCMAMPPAKAEPLLLHYAKREVDLWPYYYGFPYNIREVSRKSAKVYYTEDAPDGGSYLYVQPWDPESMFAPDRSRATRVSTSDIEQINFWGRRYNEVLDALIVSADEDKREDMNLWLFSEHHEHAVKLTDVDCIYAFAQSPDHRTVAFNSRYGTSDDHEGCIELLHIAEDRTTSIEKLFCDQDARIPAKLNWWGTLRVDDRSVVFTALADGSRQKKEMYQYDRATGDLSRIAARSDGAWLGVISSWEDENTVLYAQDKALHLYDLDSGEDSELHRFENSFRITALKIDGRDVIQTTTKDVSKTTFEVFVLDGTELRKTDGFVVDMNAGFEHAEDDRVILYKQSADTLIDYEQIHIDGSGRIRRTPFIAGLADLYDQLAHCHVSQIRYGYVDRHGGPDVTRQVDAYLYEPRGPVAPEDRLYVIEAFYGGYNSFSRGIHSMCQVGITVLSPVVRGDSWFGAAFETLNDGKNADAPIRDVIAGARYLQTRYQLSDSRRIGTMGYSHGGWAAVRALSYPGPEPFAFGFALAGAGIYDILQMADGAPEGQTNIRGWFDKEFGDLETERDHLAYLSVTAHLDRLKAPVFLYHGRNDERITALHSISFANRLRAAGKAHDLLIIEGQGHSIRGARNWHKIYAAMFRFLDAVNTDLR